MFHYRIQVFKIGLGEAMCDESIYKIHLDYALSLLVLLFEDPSPQMEKVRIQMRHDCIDKV